MMRFKKLNHSYYFITTFLFLCSWAMPYSLQAQDRKDETNSELMMKAALPDSLEGYTTKDLSVHSFDFPGAIPVAKGHYEGDNRQHLFFIQIYDIENASSEKIKRKFDWTLKPLGFDDENGTVIKYKGYKARKGYTEIMKRGRLSVLVNDHFIIDISGNKVEWAAIEKVFQKIDLEKLEARKE